MGSSSDLIPDSAIAEPETPSGASDIIPAAALAPHAPIEPPPEPSSWSLGPLGDRTLQFGLGAIKGGFNEATQAAGSALKSAGTHITDPLNAEWWSGLGDTINHSIADKIKLMGDPERYISEWYKNKIQGKSAEQIGEVLGPKISSLAAFAGPIAAARMAPVEAAASEAPSGASLSTAFDSEPIKGGLPPASVQARADVLRRVGLPTARDSALRGDALDAATDYQLSNVNEPAGVDARAQFDSERTALQNHAESVVKNTGGTLGMDEDSLNTRGQTIAAPFDKLRQWFADQKTADYAAADAKAGGAPVGKMESTATLLKDPDFSETLLAKDQGGLLGSVQRQFERFNELNPGGWTAETAENFRKWLNQVWTPENSATLGKLKAAVDDDVLKGAGEDIYGPARARVQLEHQLLDNPNGVSKLFDSDPRTPINRTTPFEKIPDTLWRLPSDQFQNVLETLKQMPAEVQPEAQAALAEIKAHGVNKLAEAGTSTQRQWNSPGVTKILKGSASKFQQAFADDPEGLNAIRDLDSAGRILKVDQGYPGAAAQASNLVKRGMMSKALGRGGGATGALAGSLMGPIGSAAGAAAGEALGGRLGVGLSERAALNQWRSGLVPLSGPQ